MVSGAQLLLVHGPDSSDDGVMATRGRGRGTVTWWRAEEAAGVIDGAELPGICWVDASVVDGPADLVLRAGQVVELEWDEPGPPGYSCRATWLAAGDDLQTTPGG